MLNRSILMLMGLLTFGLGACERSPRASEDHGKGEHPDTTGTEVGGKGMGTATETGVTGMPTGMIETVVNLPVAGRGATGGGGGAAGLAPR